MAAVLNKQGQILAVACDECETSCRVGECIAGWTGPAGAVGFAPGVPEQRGGGTPHSRSHPCGHVFHCPDN
jgi:hypothetical protein